MRIIYITLLILSFVNCYRHYFVRDVAKYDLTQEEESILKNTKIGVLGFHPFYEGYNDDIEPRTNFLSNDYVKVFQFAYDKTDTELIPFEPNHFIKWSGRSRIDWRLSSRNTAAQYLPLAASIKLPIPNETNTTIPKKNLKNFLRIYLEEVKHLNSKEIMNLLNFSIKGQIYLKGFDFDYWIIGFHSPTEKGHNWQVIVSRIFSTYSFGLIPVWDNEKIKSKFWIFDKKFNLVRKIEFENEYAYIAATWIFWKTEDYEIKSEITPIEVFEPDLKEFSKELVKVVREQNQR